MKLAIAVAIVTMLAGCVSLQERYAAECARLGIHRGDPDFWSCMQMADMQRARQMNASLGMMQAGSGMLQTQQPTLFIVH